MQHLFIFGHLGATSEVYMLAYSCLFMHPADKEQEKHLLEVEACGEMHTAATLWLFYGLCLLFGSFALLLDWKTLCWLLYGTCELDAYLPPSKERGEDGSFFFGSAFCTDLCDLSGLFHLRPVFTTWKRTVGVRLKIPFPFDCTFM